MELAFQGAGDMGQEILGRDKQLQYLKGLWQRVKEGNPQWVTLVGETGTGKTRLAQEFFRHISRDDDPGNYWPDILPIDGQLLGLNPHPEAFEQNRTGGDLQLPWLWWGVRCAEPGRRNPAETNSAFMDALEPFSIHIDPLLKLRERREASIDATKEIARNLASMATGGSIEPLLAILTLLGKASGVIKASKAEPSVPQLALTRSQSMSTLIVDSIFRYLEMQVPVVLVLDDCHWMNSESVDITKALINKLGSQKLKLFVIATSWKREFEEQNKNPLREVLARDNTDGRPVVGSFLGEMHEVKLNGLDEPDAGRVMSRLLSGLSEKDIQTVYTRTGGNVRYIYEICDYLRRKSRNFEQNDPSRPLSALAKSELLSKETELDDLIDKRFCELDGQVQRALQISSFQGPRFDVRATEDAASALAQAEPDYLTKSLGELIETAERPGSMISTLEPDIREFLPGPYWRVVRKNLQLTQEDSVSRSYQSILPMLLGKPISDLNNVQIGLIASLAEVCEDKELVRQCRAVLTRAFCRLQRYEMALEQMVLIAQAELVALRTCGADFSECGLQIISRFGVRSPIDVSGSKGDFGIWLNILAGAIYEEMNEFEPSSSVDALRRRIRQLATIATAHDTLGEIPDCMQAYLRLADFINEAIAFPNLEFDEADTIEMVNHFALALEKCAPYYELYPWLVKKFRSWIKASEKLWEGAKSEIVRRLLRGRIGIVELQIHEAIHEEDSDGSEIGRKFARAANDIGEVLASRYHFRERDRDSYSLRLPCAQIALATSTCRVIEQALGRQTLLSHDFIDSLRLMIDAIGEDAEEGKYLSPQLASALVDSVVAASIFLAREIANEKPSPEVPKEFPFKGKVLVIEDRPIEADEAIEWSRFALGLMERYYESNKGSVEFLVARSRAFVLVLDKDETLRESRAETYFNAVLADAIASEDGKREMLSEPPQFKSWLQKIRNNWLSGPIKERATTAILNLYTSDDVGGLE